MMAHLLALLCNLHLDEATVPEQEVAPLSARDHLAIRQLHIGWTGGRQQTHAPHISSQKHTIAFVTTMHRLSGGITFQVHQTP